MLFISLNEFESFLEGLDENIVENKNQFIEFYDLVKNNSWEYISFNFTTLRPLALQKIEEIEDNDENNQELVPLM